MTPTIEIKHRNGKVISHNYLHTETSSVNQFRRIAEAAARQQGGIAYRLVINNTASSWQNI